MTTRGVNPATASPAARERAAFFPDRRSLRMGSSAAFRKAAACPKPTGAPSYAAYVGRTDSSRWISAAEHRVLLEILNGADLLGVRQEPVVNRGTGEAMDFSRPVAYLLLRIEASRLDDLATIGAAHEDFEESAEVEGWADDDMCLAESGDAFTWTNPSEGDDRSDPDAGHLRGEPPSFGSSGDDAEAEATDAIDQRHWTAVNCDGRELEHDGREPGPDDGDGPNPELEAANRRLNRRTAIVTDPQGKPCVLTMLGVRS
jgi:hypothetical protein